jgi:hypothetical protein
MERFYLQHVGCADHRSGQRSKEVHQAMEWCAILTHNCWHITWWGALLDLLGAGLAAVVMVWAVKRAIK